VDCQLALLVSRPNVQGEVRRNRRFHGGGNPAQVAKLAERRHVIVFARLPRKQALDGDMRRLRRSFRL
jgi:hypothetical protein